MNWSLDLLLELQIWTRLAALAYGQATSQDLFQAICSRALALDKPNLFKPDSYVPLQCIALIHYCTLIVQIHMCIQVITALIMIMNYV